MDKDEKKETKSKIEVQNKGILGVWTTKNPKVARWTRQARKSEVRRAACHNTRAVRDETTKVRRMACHNARAVMNEERAETKRVKVQMISLSVVYATNGT